MENHKIKKLMNYYQINDENTLFDKLVDEKINELGINQFSNKNNNENIQIQYLKMLKKYSIYQLLM